MPVYHLASERLGTSKLGFSGTMDGVYERLDEARTFCIDYKLIDIIPEGTMRDEKVIQKIGKQAGLHLGREQFQYGEQIVEIFKGYKMDVMRQGSFDFDACGCTTPIILQVPSDKPVSQDPSRQHNLSIVRNRQSKKLPALAIPSLELPNGKKARITPDRRCISIFDFIEATGQKSPHTVWKRLSTQFSEVLTKCKYHLFPDGSNKETPVTDREGLLYIASKLPGRHGRETLEELVRTTLRVWDGDITLVEEMVDRFDDPFKAKRIAIRAEAKASNLVLTRTITAHGGRKTPSQNIYAVVNGKHNKAALGVSASTIKKSSNKRTVRTRDDPRVTAVHLSLLNLAEVTSIHKMNQTNVSGNTQIVETVIGVCRSIESFRRDNGIAGVEVANA